MMKQFPFQTQCNGSIQEVVVWLQTIQKAVGNITLSFEASFNPEEPPVKLAYIDICANEYGRGKISMIKAVRQASQDDTGVAWGLKDAKDYVELNWAEIQRVYENSLGKCE